MPALRVLVFDDPLSFDPYTSGLIRAGITIEVTYVGDIHSKYHPDTAALARATFATIDTFDAVVIGNNLGAGAIIANALSRELRMHAMVVWATWPPSRIDAYSGTGITYFGTRASEEPSVLSTERFLALRAREIGLVAE